MTTSLKTRSIGKHTVIARNNVNPKDIDAVTELFAAKQLKIKAMLTQLYFWHYVITHDDQLFLCDTSNGGGPVYTNENPLSFDVFTVLVNSLVNSKSSLHNANISVFINALKGVMIENFPYSEPLQEQLALTYNAFCLANNELDEKVFGAVICLIDFKLKADEHNCTQK